MASQTSRSVRIIGIIGTCDTKLDELLYLHEYVTSLSEVYLSSAASIKPILIDIGRTLTSNDRIATSISSLLSSTDFKSRNDLIPTIGATLKTHLTQLAKDGELHGVLAIGGSCGSSIVAESLQALPFGFPKVLVSTMASGDIKPYVGCSDITIMYSVVDIAGLNGLLKAVLKNAAGAITGMVAAKVPPTSGENFDIKESPKRRVAMTMFGITTPACDHARKLLEENGCEVYVFHATGSGGMAMEKLILEGAFDGVLDLTTTELADEAFGGVLSAGSERLKGAVKTGTPTVISLGALDCVNFGPKDTVPERYIDRRLHVHNSAVTLMRTNEGENAHLGKVISSRIRENLTTGGETKVEIWMPMKSVSLIDQEGAVFSDKGANQALYTSVKDGFSGTGIRIHEVDQDINDPVFAEAVARSILKMMDT